jgi:nucleoid-associated protein YgaU
VSKVGLWPAGVSAGSGTRVVQGRIWILGGGALSVAAVVAAWLALRFDRPVVELPEADRLSAAAPAAVSAPPVPASGGEAAVTEAQPMPPAFDVVRVATDGGALVAGRAAPGSAVDLLVDGVVVAQALADPAGQFVAIFALDPSAEPQVMSLAMVLADGASVPSEDVVVLAPRAAPEAAVAEVAEATQGDGVAAVSGGADADPVAIASSSVAGEAGGASEAPSVGAVERLADVEATAAEGSVGEADQAAVAEGPIAVPVASETADVDLAPQVVAAASETAEAEEGAAVVTAAAGPVAADEAPEVIAGASGPAEADEAPAVVAVASGPETDEVPAGVTGAPENVQDGTPVDLVSADSLVPEGAGAESVVPLAAASTDAAAPPDFLLDRTGRVRVLDAAPQALDNVVVDAIGYDADGSVQVSGRARQGAEGAALRIYLDNRPLAVARAQAGHWQLDLPEVAPGIYTLRVDELDGAGQVVSRFETPFLREDPVAVARLLAVPAGVGEAAGLREAEGDRTVGGASQTNPLPLTPTEGGGATTEATTTEATTTEAASGAALTALANGESGGAGQADPAVRRSELAQTESEGARADTGAQIAAAGGGASETTAAPSSAVSIAEPGGARAEGDAASIEATGTALAQVDTVASETSGGTPHSVTAEANASTQPAEPTADRATARVTLITVQPGQSLWRISHQHYGDGARYVQIFRANRAQIRNPNLIYPGQIFTLPE